MASQVPAVKGAAFDLYFTLYKSDGTVIANPGTYTKKISKDGGTIADCANAVTEVDTTYGLCKLTLSTTEMNADAVWVQIKDDTTGCVPLTQVIYTSAQTADTIDTNIDTLLTRLTATRAGYMDQLEHIHDDTNNTYTAVTSGTYGNSALKTLIDTLTSYVDTEVAAIKAKTDQLAFTTANKVDARAFTVDDKTGYSLSVTPPTAAQVRTEMDANSTKLANLDAAVSTRLATAGYSAPLDAAGTRTAVGLATNNLDTQLTDIHGHAAAANTTTPPTVGEIADAVLDEVVSGHTTDNTLGERVTAIATLAGSSAVDIWDILAALTYKVETDPTTGIMTVYAGDDTTTYFSANVYEDVDGMTPYDGTNSINRRDRLVKPT